VFRNGKRPRTGECVPGPRLVDLPLHCEKREVENYVDKGYTGVEASDECSLCLTCFLYRLSIIESKSLILTVWDRE
jgi:hypothetical protein